MVREKRATSHTKDSLHKYLRPHLGRWPLRIRKTRRILWRSVNKLKKIEVYSIYSAAIIYECSLYIKHVDMYP